VSNNNTSHTLNAEDRLLRGKIKLQREQPFYAYLLLGLECVKNNKIPTAGVDMGRHMYYNEKWVQNLSDEHLKFVLCHEILHVVLCHLIRGGTRKHRLFNIAADIVINAMLVEDGFSTPPDVIQIVDNRWEYKDAKGKKHYIDKCSEKSSEEVYDELQKISEDMDERDAHYKCDGNCQPGDGDGQCKGGGECTCGNEFGDVDQFDEHMRESGMSQDEIDEAKEEFRRQMVEAATHAKSRGNMPGSMKRILDDLLNPQLDWKTLLYNYITKDIIYDFTMKRPGRRSFAAGVYLPTVLRENLDIDITIDTSGSIGAEEYKSFMSEVIGIANAFESIKMNIIFWDTQVREPIEKVTMGNKEHLLKMTPKGGGGTTMSCLGKYYEGKQLPKLIVTLTDGYVECNPKLPMGVQHLFVLSKDSSDEQLKGLGVITKLK